MLRQQIDSIQKQLKAENIDGWLFCGFANTNLILNNLFSLSPTTRKFFVLIKKNQKPIIIHSQIEKDIFSKLNFIKKPFLSRREMINLLKSELKDLQVIALDFSPSCNLPKISIIDHGTFELIRTISRAKLISSANLIQSMSCWNREALANHLKSAELLSLIKDKAFKLIPKGQNLTTHELQNFLISELTNANLVTDHKPVVAVGKDTRNPHYVTEDSRPKKIVRDQLILIDLWAKLDRQNSPFADITWIGFKGNEVPEKINDAWKIISEARNSTVKFIQSNWKRKNLCGFEVDNFCRSYITKKGFGKFFIHRTGHSLGLGNTLHGETVNLDNFESHDDRLIIPNVGFSVEPGIYLLDFGIRSEINMFIDPKEGPLVTTEVQKEILQL